MQAIRVKAGTPIEKFKMIVRIKKTVDACARTHTLSYALYVLKRKWLVPLLGIVFLREEVLVFEKSLSTLSKIETRTDIDCRLAQGDDLLRLAKEFRKQGLEKRTKIGHLCFIAYRMGEIAHYKWLAFNKAYLGPIKRELSIRPDSAYIYDAYTPLEHRGLGISPYVTINIFNYLHEKGYKKVYACILYDNFSALRTAQKAGYRKMGTIILNKIFVYKKYNYYANTQKDYNKLKELFSLETVNSM